jgi:hypothetical protein
MTISHPDCDMGDGAFMFAKLADVSCSVCAPNAMGRAAIEAFATSKLRPGIGGWQAVDKSRFGLGTPTPNPCNIDPANRRHWFLFNGMTAEMMAQIHSEDK